MPSHSLGPQFLEWALNFWKGSMPLKIAYLRRQTNFVDAPKKIPCREWVCQVLFGKNWKKICQIWPRRPLKHFTAAYRGFPPCTQSQPPINRETGYSNVLVFEWTCVKVDTQSELYW